MKITKSRLKQIIKEEISKVLNEGIPAKTYWYITAWPRGIEAFGKVDDAGGFKTVLAADSDEDALKEVGKTKNPEYEAKLKNIAHFTVHKAKAIRTDHGGPEVVKKDGSVWIPDTRRPPHTAYGGIQEGMDNGRLPRKKKETTTYDV